MTWRSVLRYVSGWMRWWSWVVGALAAWWEWPRAGGRARSAWSGREKIRGH